MQRRHSSSASCPVRRLVVGDTFVAIDAGLAVLQWPARGFLARGFCFVVVHAPERVAVAALERVVGLHAGPLALGEVQALGLEFLARVDAADGLAVELARWPGSCAASSGSIPWARDSRGKWRARRCGWCSGSCSRNTPCRRCRASRGSRCRMPLVGGFDGRVETAPEHDADGHADHQQGQQRPAARGRAQSVRQRPGLVHAGVPLSRRRAACSRR